MSSIWCVYFCFFIILPPMQRWVFFFPLLTRPINRARTLRSIQKNRHCVGRSNIIIIIIIWMVDRRFCRCFWMRDRRCRKPHCWGFFCVFGSSDSRLRNRWLLFFSIQMKISHFKDQLSLNQPVISHFIKLKRPPVTSKKISLQLFNWPRKPRYNLQLVKQPRLHAII